MQTKSKILISRAMTRFGDQAWDFAVPLTLIQIFPHRLDYIAYFYLISKLINIFMGPFLFKRIDHASRLNIYKVGITTQVLAMVLTLPILIYWLNESPFNELFYPFFIITTILYAWGTLGSTLMEISVGFDLAVDALPKDTLSKFNERLKRVDLITEVTAPLIAGVILSTSITSYPYLGLILIAILNLLTFIPEYLLLKSVNATVKKEKEFIPSKKFKLRNLIFHIDSFIDLKNKSYLPIILSYSLVWFSVLSPHGVLLTTYLKDIPKLTELELAFFRGAGALFGIIPTFIYSPIHKKMGLLKTTKFFLFFQFLTVALATLLFQIDQMVLFIVAILFSRIGLYGFSIGETELRQRLIPNNKRGEVNGVVNSLTNGATIIIFLLAGVISKSSNFNYLVILTFVALSLSFLTSYFQKQSDAI